MPAERTTNGTTTTTHQPIRQNLQATREHRAQRERVDVKIQVEVYDLGERPMLKARKFIYYIRLFLIFRFIPIESQQYFVNTRVTRASKLPPDSDTTDFF